MTRLTRVFAATALVAGIIAGVLWKQLHDERVLSAQLRERVALLGRRPIEAPAPACEVAAVPAPVPVAATCPTPPPASANRAVSSVAQNLARGLDFCTAQKALLRARMIEIYPDMGTVLALSLAEFEALTETLLRHQESDLSCGPEGEAMRQPSVSAAAREQARQTEVAALLGPQKFQEWQEYLPTREGRLNVNRLRNALSTSDTPLTDQQAGPLLDSVLAEGKRLRAEKEALVPPTSADPLSKLDFEEESLRLTEASQARLLGSIQSYLGPQQIAVMKNAMTAVNSRQRAMLATQRAQLEALGGTGRMPVLVDSPER